MSKEFRRARRRQLTEPVEVTDALTDEVLGRLGNLSETGMLLLGRDPGVEDGLFQVHFSLPLPQGGSHRFSLGVHQLWSEAHASRAGFWSGFRFIDVAAREQDLLRGYVEQPGGAVA